jgi:hypothetical protein
MKRTRPWHDNGDLEAGELNAVATGYDSLIREALVYDRISGVGGEDSLAAPVLSARGDRKGEGFSGGGSTWLRIIL